MKLTAEQKEESRTQGFLIARGALSDADLQPVIDELSEWIGARAQQLHDEGKIEGLHEHEPLVKCYDLLFG